MSYQDEETAQFSMFDVSYAATCEQSNDLLIHINATIDAARFQQVDMLLKSVRMDAADKGSREYAEGLCCEYAELSARLAQEVRAKLLDMGVAV